MDALVGYRGGGWRGMGWKESVSRKTIKKRQEGMTISRDVERIEQKESVDTECTIQNVCVLS